MVQTKIVKNILSFYEGENTAIKSKLYQLLMHGKLGGTGKMIILPVDQGFEHGPSRSFIMNPASYDPDYFFNLALNAGLNAYAAPLGLLQASAHKFAGQIPIILKLNSNNSLYKNDHAADQAFTSTVRDAVELGCIGVGITIYPGSALANDMLEEASSIIREAKDYGLISVVWSYPRNKDFGQHGESAIDTCVYAAHMAALLGAHVIKVKLPTQEIFDQNIKKLYEQNDIQISTLDDRIAHVMQSCFNSKRLVVFSGGGAKNEHELLEEIRAINRGGGSGSIIGRNSFQRSYDDAIELLAKISNIYHK